MATMALVGAGIIAAASAGGAVYRSGEAASEEAGPHGSVPPYEPVADVGTMIAGLEARLAQDPNNAEGWRMLGWSYFETGDLMRSASAYRRAAERSEEHTSELQSLMRISYAVLCLKKKKHTNTT